MRGQYVVALTLRGTLGLGLAFGLAAQGEGSAAPRALAQPEAGGEGAHRVVSILAERFSFTPSEVRMARGTIVELRIRSDDTMHGFRIVGRDVNVEVPKRRHGETVVVFDATTAGRYEFQCSRLCGAGHNFMRGVIVVEDPPGAR